MSSLWDGQSGDRRPLHQLRDPIVGPSVLAWLITPGSDRDHRNEARQRIGRVVTPITAFTARAKTMDGIRAALESAISHLSDHPGEATYTDSVATATLLDGLRVRTTGSAGETVMTDMPASIGGTASAPSAGWLLRAAEASCVATVVAMRAAQLGQALGTLTVTVDSVSDDRGILGMADAIPA